MIGPRLVFSALACANFSWCQNAQLSGLIRDPSESIIAGADISLRNELTGGRRVTQSNESGLYSLPSLNPGIYRITIRAHGFETVVRGGVQLEVGDNLRLDFTLRIGDARTVITVSDGSPLMNTEDGSVGSVIDRTLIEHMPLNGRGLQSLIELSPGVTVVPVTPFGVGQFAVNGQRQDVNYFTIDGVSANFSAATVSGLAGNNYFGVNNGQLGAGNLPALSPLGTFANLVSPDALQEFRIQTSSFAPEFGRTPGAQIGFVTRSGTNRYGGSFVNFFRNEITDANDWFRNFSGFTKPVRRFRDSTVTLGGPLQIPRLYQGRDRTFFFFSFQDSVLRQSRPRALTLTPTAQSRRGASAAVAPFLNALPLPNDPGVGYWDAPPGWAWFSTNQFEHFDQRTYALRVDHYFNDRLTAFARYNYAPSAVTDQPTGNNPANARHYNIDTRMITAGLTQVIGPGLVNELRWNGSLQTTREFADIENLGGAKPPPDSALFPPGYSAQDSSYFLLQGTYAQSLSIYYGLQSATRARQMQWTDNVSYVNGKHRLKLGVDYRWYSPVFDPPRLTVVSIILSPGIETAENPVQSVGYARQSHAVYRFQNFSIYAQDTWRPSERLTLTYGLRWDVNPAPRLSGGEARAFSQPTSLYDLSNLTPLPEGRALYPTRYSQIAPRLGLAWQLFDASNQKTVLRIGGGVFFDPAQSGLAFASQQPFILDIYRDVPLGPVSASPESRAYDGSEGILAAPGYTTPRIYEWNVTLEQSFGPQTVSAAYVAARGVKLVGSARYADDVASRLVRIAASRFRSSYDALQLRYNRRLAGRVQSLVAYTWSHSLDNLSFSMRPTAFEDLLLPDISHSSSDFDIRHSLSGALLLTPPAPRAGIFGQLLRNWTVSGIFFARSAPPTDIAADGGGVTYRRPDVISGQPLYLYGNGYPGGKRANPDAFSKPAVGVLHGSLGRNVLRMFGAWQIDLALERRIPLSDRISLQFRAESFNVLNHPNFASPSYDARSPQIEALRGAFGLSPQMLGRNLGNMEVLGQLQTAFQIGQPRTCQFAVRLIF